MKSNKNKKIYIILSVFGIISLLLAIFLIWPLFKEISDKSADLILTKSNIADLDSQISEVEKFKKNYQEYKPNFDKIDRLFIDANNPVEFIEFLENSATQLQVTSQISLSQVTVAPQPFVTVRVSSKGSFSGVSNFVKKVETGPYLVEIQSLNIQNSQDSNAPKELVPKTFEASLSIKVFIKK